MTQFRYHINPFWSKLKLQNANDSFARSRNVFQKKTTLINRSCIEIKAGNLPEQTKQGWHWVSKGT